MDKTCDICHGAGEFYTHTKDCQSDWCALAGGMDDCLGQVLDCPECTPTPPRSHPMQDEVTVTQVDERAVAEFHRQSFETLFATTDADIDAGINRAHTLLCQAFARHRHQAERETLARMEAEIKRLREALDEIRDLPGEINPCNYDHDDACELNRQFCYAITVADRALATRQDAPVTENSHDQ